MIYAISDIHGCFDKYIAMLKKIKFSDDDILYVVGDVVNRGKHGIKILQNMSLRSNVYPIMGNHEYMALSILKSLMVEITEENYDNHIDENILEGLICWTQFDGGQVTLDEFYKLSKDEQYAIIDYLEEFAPYEIAICNGKQYLLTHAGIPTGARIDRLSDYSIAEFVTAETDYSKKYFNNIFVVTGHTPTFSIKESSRGKIYRNNNNIAIDCGASYDEKLGCFCLDTEEEFYV